MQLACSCGGSCVERALSPANAGNWPLAKALIARLKLSGLDPLMDGRVSAAIRALLLERTSPPPAPLPMEPTKRPAAKAIEPDVLEMVRTDAPRSFLSL